MNDLNDETKRCVKSLCEKFIKWPSNFFTESDAHSYLYLNIFTSKYNDLKKYYWTRNNEDKTVLIHREYPTSFRYKKKSPMRLDERSGGRGHYDLVVLNPEFISAFSIEEIIAQNYKICRKDYEYQVLAAIEFKLITRPLSAHIKEEIIKDFQKLTWAIEKKQAKEAYMITLNRARKEEGFQDSLKDISKGYPLVKAVYIESIKGKKRSYKPVYLNWEHKVRFQGSK